MGRGRGGPTRLREAHWGGDLSAYGDTLPFQRAELFAPQSAADGADGVVRPTRSQFRRTEYCSASSFEASPIGLPLRAALPARRNNTNIQRESACNSSFGNPDTRP